MDDLLALSALDLSRAYQEGRVRPSEVVELALKRAEACEPAVNAFVELKPEEARAMARESDRRWRVGEPLSMLDGCVTSVKDTMQFAGWQTGRGSRLTRGAAPAATDTHAIAALRAAGLVFTGRTTVPEFAHKTVTESPVTGITRNPWDVRMTSGGSSGGAAVAVATGANTLALGTDAGGSIRVPCSYCGLFGLKPTFGRVPQFPPTPSFMLVHTGPMARTVGDARAMMRVICPSPEWAISAPADASGMRITLAFDLGFGEPSASAREALAKSGQWLSDLGARVESVSLDLSWAEPVFEVLFCSGAQFSFEGYDDAQRCEISESFRDLARTGEGYTKRDYQLALTERELRIAELRQFFEHSDLLLCPISEHGPFPVGRDIPESYGDMPWYRSAGYATAFNISGNPAATVPVGLDDEGLPVSVQLVGRHGADSLVLNVAEMIETKAGFRSLVHRPELLARLR